MKKKTTHRKVLCRHKSHAARHNDEAQQEHGPGIYGPATYTHSTYTLVAALI